MDAVNLKLYSALDACLTAIHGQGPGDLLEENSSIIEQLDTLYTKTISEYEELMWKSGINDSKLALFQQLHREYQLFRSHNGQHHDKEFIVIIPVADRPRHLEQCLASLFRLCQLYEYGGFNDGRYEKIRVLLADDSALADNVRQHQQIAETYTRKGLEVEYFGQQQQLDVVHSSAKFNTDNIKHIIGEHDAEHFYHKGASVMRNIVYLKLMQMNLTDERSLVYLVDSDQEFNITTRSSSGDKKYYAINYLYELNRVFNERPVAIATGKVVGDPPVSPAVMTNRMLDDVCAFLADVRQRKPEACCEYHGDVVASRDDASYHDMADLFGFSSKDSEFSYHCDLQGRHTHLDCAENFASRLQAFFHGAHPTRKTWYEYKPASESVAPARTVYTGNYIIRPSATRFFIPFAQLKLRMAGPTLGRVIKSQLGDQFVSINLPMNHARTVTDNGLSEYRSGVDRSHELFDLSGEFERQYFGDVMLFSMEKLTRLGYPERKLDEATISQVLIETDVEMYDRYHNKQAEILRKLVLLEKLMRDSASWWSQSDQAVSLRDHIELYMQNIKYNFYDDASAIQLINDAIYRKRQIASMCSQLVNYYDDRRAWESLEMCKS